MPGEKKNSLGSKFHSTECYSVTNSDHIELVWASGMGAHPRDSCSSFIVQVSHGSYTSNSYCKCLDPPIFHCRLSVEGCGHGDIQAV